MTGRFIRLLENSRARAGAVYLASLVRGILEGLIEGFHEGLTMMAM